MPELHPPLSTRQLTAEIVPLESVSVNSSLGFTIARPWSFVSTARWTGDLRDHIELDSDYGRGNAGYRHRDLRALAMSAIDLAWNIQ